MNQKSLEPSDLLPNERPNAPDAVPPDTTMLRILWCDNANVIRAKSLCLNAKPIPSSEAFVGISEAMQAVPVMYDIPAEGTGLIPVGEVQLTADLSSLVPLPYAQGQSRVMGDMLKDGVPWACCPRSFLKRMIARAEDMRLTVKGAFENEFYLLKSVPGQIEPVDNTTFASTYAMDISADVITDIVQALTAQGITVEQYYPESGPGQQEITVRYASALQACDHQITFRETVRAVAQKHGLRASFLPKILADKTGSGCHLHLSLWQDSTNILSDEEGIYGMSNRARQFIAGIISHLPALMALTTPIPNSYRRIKPSTWSGAFQCWGFANREAAVRIVVDRDKAIRHFEVKTVDASSNPYLAFGAIIAAGLDGIERSMEPSAPIQLDPSSLSTSERERLNISFLPSSTSDALEFLESDQVILASLGNELARVYGGVKRTEIEALESLTLEQEVELLLEKY
ncbi:MAG: glutamine synthetase [Euryarchaeota archaeon]|nr:glutamine synthetase [Euryarchaeota archaeon]